MKILFISDNKINGFGGGCIENKKHYVALKNYCREGDTLKVISTDDNFFDSIGAKIYKNKYLDILVRLLGHSSFLYFTMLFDGKRILDYKPDIIYLCRSRFGFFAKWIKKNLPNCKVITNVDNVEYDYVDSYFSKTIGTFAKIKKYIEKIVVQRDEKLIIEYSDKLIFLTERNVKRYEELYGYKEKKPCIIPICLDTTKELNIVNGLKNVVFIGSLDYAANINAVENLIKIWKEKFVNDSSMFLIIAGRNPNEDLQNSIGALKNAMLINNFEDIINIVPKHSLMLAPIELGAGMKVKVAESLSLGLFIGGSNEALVGYEEALNASKLYGNIIRCNNEKDYVNCICQFIKKREDELFKIEAIQKDLFKRYYSYERSNKAIKDVINEIYQ